MAMFGWLHRIKVKMLSARRDVNGLVNVLTDPKYKYDEETKLLAIRCLGDLGDDRAIKPMCDLVGYLSPIDKWKQDRILSALAKFDSLDIMDGVEKYLYAWGPGKPPPNPTNDVNEIVTKLGRVVVPHLFKLLARSRTSHDYSPFLVVRIRMFVDAGSYDWHAEEWLKWWEQEGKQLDWS